MSLGRSLRIGLVAFLSVAVMQARATTWIVDDDGPADFRTLQSAADAPYVLSGDTILVRPGRYVGNLVLNTKDLVIGSEAGPLLTILDGDDSGSVVSFLNRTAATRLEGFTVTNGRGATGGGVWILGGAPVITRNVITGNAAVGGFLGYGYGGGIEIYSSAATVDHNVIQGNTARDGGAGIDVYYAGPSTPATCCPTLVRNTILDNTVTHAGGMGGGLLSFASEPRFSSNIVAGNSAAAGGGIHVYKVQGNNDAPDAAYNMLFGNLPTPSDSNANWRLPSSNPIADPRLEASLPRPRSDSPALDAAEAGLDSPVDLLGLPDEADSDLDGTERRDVGALENEGEVTGLSIAPVPALPGAARLTWDGAVDAEAVYHLYAHDDAPFIDNGGFCLAAALPDPEYVDEDALAAGHLRFYLVTAQGVQEGSRGFRSDGTPRPGAPSCASP